MEQDLVSRIQEKMAQEGRDWLRTILQEADAAAVRMEAGRLEEVAGDTTGGRPKRRTRPPARLSEEGDRVASNSRRSAVRGPAEAAEYGAGGKRGGGAAHGSAGEILVPVSAGKEGGGGSSRARSRSVLRGEKGGKVSAAGGSQQLELEVVQRGLCEQAQRGLAAYVTGPQGVPGCRSGSQPGAGTRGRQILRRAVRSIPGAPAPARVPRLFEGAGERSPSGSTRGQSDRGLGREQLVSGLRVMPDGASRSAGWIEGGGAQVFGPGPVVRSVEVGTGGSVMPGSPGSSRASSAVGLVLNDTMFCGMAPLGTHLSADIKERIWKGEYVDVWSLLSADSMAVDRERSFDKGGKAIVAHTFHNWLQGFSTLAFVICQRQPKKSPDLFIYQESIFGAFRLHGGSAWWRYDEDFRRRLALKPEMGWATKATDVWLHFILAQKQVPPFQGGAGGSASSGPSAPRATGACWLFNEGHCRFLAQCRYRHECSICSGSHAAIRCFKRARQVGRAGVAGASDDSRERSRDGAVASKI
ncbi:hypothetical protein PRIEUP_LOCUS807, partial [Pristimantis euphronides]